MRLALIAVLFTVVPVAAQQPGSGWTGKIVILKGDREVKIGTADAKGVPIYHATLKGISYRVIDDKGAWILVMQDNAEGWFEKTNAVLLDDAKTYFGQRINSNPKDEQAYGYRAEASMLLNDPKNAINDLSEAIRINPKRAVWWSNRAFVRIMEMDFAKALEDANEAIKLDPKLVRGYLVRGLVYRGQKQIDKAVGEFTEALRIDSRATDALHARANVRWDEKNYTLAAKDYEELLKLQPYHEDGLNEFSWLLSTCPDDKLRDGKRALDLAKKLNKITREQNPEHLDTMAAAYAETAQFMDAIRYMNMALKSNGLAKDLQEGFEKRLKLYQAGMKYRDQ